MARSSYIYILVDEATEFIIGTFTVKHEMKTWVKLHPDIRCKAFRHRDGQPLHPVSEVPL
jgi:hypothetical protein